jgi:ribosomal protein L37AE/L43A
MADKTNNQKQKRPKKRCPECGRAMVQQFIGLKHCKCGVTWKKDEGYFERTSDMVFALEKTKNDGKTKQVPVVRHKRAPD